MIRVIITYIGMAGVVITGAIMMGNVQASKQLWELAGVLYLLLGFVYGYNRIKNDFG